jgi:arylsulfatase A-like enzyme
MNRGLPSPRAARAALLALAGAALLAACGRAPPATTPAAPGEVPVVLYLIDTLRADRLGLYGYGKPTSPQLDALARESVVFDAAYAAAPWTLPSVGSLLTSTYSCEHGLLRHNQRLSPKLATLAERLQARGYATGGYFQNAIVGPLSGLDRGLQVAELHDDSTASLAPEASAFLERAQGRPFFLYLHTMEPHAIEQVPPAFLKTLGHVSVDDREAYTAHWDRLTDALHIERKQGAAASEAAREDAALAMQRLTGLGDSVTRLYDAAVLQADTNLGTVIDLLQERGIWDKVIFIVLADHGEAFGEHGTWFHEHTVYEELVRVPLLIRFPGGEHGGRRVAERVSLLDVVPTVLDYLNTVGNTVGNTVASTVGSTVGGAPDDCTGCRGRSLLPLARGTSAGWQPADVPALRINRTVWYEPWQALRGDVNVAVRDGAWKGIWNEEPGRTELYDLAADPGETRDLADGSAARARELGARAERWLAACRAALVAPIEVPESEIDEATRQRLRALGYLR